MRRQRAGSIVRGLTYTFCLFVLGWTLWVVTAAGAVPDDILTQQATRWCRANPQPNLTFARCVRAEAGVLESEGP